MDKRENIAILGFGVEGKEMMQWLQKHNYPNLTVCDQNTELEAEMPEGVSVRLGENYLENLKDFDTVIRSPGIRFLNSNIQLALSQGVNVLSTTALFFDLCPCPIIGVTGTKGKGTTSTLIYEMLKKKGEDVYLGGNIGNPPVSFLDELKGDSLVVLELSSFQLQDLKKSPRYAVLLNTTVDHLDYHVDRNEYMMAKESLLAHQREESVAVLNKDYEYSKYYGPLVKGELQWVSVRQEVENGAFVKDGGIFYAKDGKTEKIAKTLEVALIGSHNLENVMPATVIAKQLGVSTEDILAVIKSFRGLPHRLEFAGEVHGVRYYNDSYSTTPETSMAAVDSFDVPTVLIAGGYDKGLDYHDWAKKILTKESLRVVILVGDTADKMEQCLEEAKKVEEATPTEIVRCKNLMEAVTEAAAKDCKVVVMSPASSSFDLYKNYKERGEKFKELVKNLG